MVAVFETYQNCYVKLDKDYSSDNPVKVIVTFLEYIEPRCEEGISLSDFSFFKSQNNLENFKSSFSEAVVEKRRHAL